MLNKRTPWNCGNLGRVTTTNDIKLAIKCSVLLRVYRQVNRNLQYESNSGMTYIYLSVFATHSTMGTAVRNLRVGVNWTPSSICSQCVHRRLTSFSMLSQGAPLMICRKYRCACTQEFNDQFIDLFFFPLLTALCSKLVIVQANGIVTKGTDSSSKWTRSRPRK